MGINTIDTTYKAAGDHELEKLVDGGLRGVLDNVSLAPNPDGSGDQLNLLQTTTFRDGTLFFGGDASDHTVSMNNGQMLVVPITGEDGKPPGAVVLEVQEREHERQGLHRLRRRVSKTLFQYRIEDVFGDEPVVTVEDPEPIVGRKVIEIDTAQFGYVKAYRRGKEPVANPAVQEILEHEELTPDQQQEFGLVGASLRALGYS